MHAEVSSAGSARASVSARGAALLLLCVFHLPGWAQLKPPPPPTPSPPSPSNQSVAGFSASILITPDADWLAKWQSPSEPHFNSVETVKRGQKVFFLTFFSNPKTRADGQASLTCQIEIVRPDGTFASQQSGIACYRAVLAGDPMNQYLSSAVVGFNADQDTAVGLWQVRVTVRDDVQGVELPLRASFTVE